MREINMSLIKFMQYNTMSTLYVNDIPETRYLHCAMRQLNKVVIEQEYFNFDRFVSKVLDVYENKRLTIKLNPCYISVDGDWKRIFK